MKNSLILPIVEKYLPPEVSSQSINGITQNPFPEDNRTNLTTRLSEICAKPIKELRTDDIATLLRQDVGDDISLAIALMLISEEPLICADSYSGDILMLTTQKTWEQWLATEVYGIDPYWLAGYVQDTIIALKELSIELAENLEKFNKTMPDFSS
ncbi:contact-dependent growth inhibition system immunity protein [Chitinimonas lacunae]|uniref:Contact-dependent growth inhibition system immunity protein n=1 Tax=Chitinimonas lacunae TaxID=1963018 RepID=A0ABV8MLZ2_9NEIS